MRQLLIALIFLTIMPMPAMAQKAKTKDGYIFCLTKETYKEAVGYAVAKDKEAWDKLMKAKLCAPLKAGVEVQIMEMPFLGGMIEIRPMGMRETVWTAIEAVELKK